MSAIVVIDNADAGLDPPGFLREDGGMDLAQKHAVAVGSDFA